MKYITDASGFFRNKSSSIEFVALPEEVQLWLNQLSGFCIYRISVENDASRTLGIYRLTEFIVAQDTSVNSNYWIVPDDFKDHFKVASTYRDIFDFEYVLMCNGFISLNYDTFNKALRVSSISCTHELINESGDRYEIIDAKKRFEKLKRILRKDLTYHTYVAPMYTPIPERFLKNPKVNEFIHATEAAIKTHREGCDWLPGPKKVVKPRARKKKT